MNVILSFSIIALPIYILFPDLLGIYAIIFLLTELIFTGWITCFPENVLINSISSFLIGGLSPFVTLIVENCLFKHVYLENSSSDKFNRKFLISVSLVFPLQLGQELLISLHLLIHDEWKECQRRNAALQFILC